MSTTLNTLPGLYSIQMRTTYRGYLLPHVNQLLKLAYRTVTPSAASENSETGRPTTIFGSNTQEGTIVR